MQTLQVYKKQNIIKKLINIMTTDNTNVNFSLNVYFNAMKCLFHNNIYFLIFIRLKKF